MCIIYVMISRGVTSYLKIANNFFLNRVYFTLITDSGEELVVSMDQITNMDITVEDFYKADARSKSE